MKLFHRGAILLALASICGTSLAMPGRSVAARGVTVTVFAAASLHTAFKAMVKEFESRHPGVTVRLSFAGSQTLVAQMAEGAPADVFASADLRWMLRAVDAKLVYTPNQFARNQLVVLAAGSSSIRSLAELATPGIKLDLCADEVPCGRYARIALRRLSRETVLGRSFAERVMHNVVSNEENVEAVVQKVSLGEADAGIAYATDIRSANASRIRLISIPARDQQPVIYSIAQTRTARNRSAASAFIAFVRSRDGRKILTAYGFGLPH